MNPHEWFVEHRTAFAVRGLAPEEEEKFLEHLPGCAECREEVARLNREFAWLPMAVAPVPPRPGLRRELVEAVLGNRRRSVRSIARPAAAAAAVLVVGVWSWGRQHSATLTREITMLRRQLTAVEDTLSVMRRASRVLQAKIEMDGHEGGLTIFTDDRTHRWNVVVNGLPPAGPGEIYQFWFITEDGMVRGVKVHVDGATSALMTLGMPAGAGAVTGACLTLESAADSTGQPKGKELAKLML